MPLPPSKLVLPDIDAISSRGVLPCMVTSPFARNNATQSYFSSSAANSAVLSTLSSFGITCHFGVPVRASMASCVVALPLKKCGR